MNFNIILPRRLRRFFERSRAQTREQHELSAVSTNSHPTAISSFNDKGSRINLLVFKDCENVEKVIQLFQSSTIEEILKDTKSVTVMKFENFDSSSEISAIQLAKISSLCIGKSIVLLFITNEDQKRQIYWKSNEFDYFLTLKLYSQFIQVDVAFFEFVAKFLSKSLENKCLGINQQLTPEPDKNEFELHMLDDYRGFDLMVAAAEIGDVCAVKILLDLGFKTESRFKDIDAQTLAYNNGHSDVLLLLFNNNASYPVNMDVNLCSKEIQDFVEMCTQLHEYIKDQNMPKVEQIIKKNPHLCHFYNEDNESVSATALRSKDIEIYEYLIENNIYFGPHEKTEEIIADLDYATQRTAREIHYKHLQELPESHINVIIGHCSINHDGNKAGKSELISQAFSILNSIVIIRMILMAVAASRKFSIIFDFNRDTVHLVDPTTSSYTNGIFYTFGRIYVAARELIDEKTRGKTLGTLAHELCHYALNLTYRNEAKPYLKSDNQRMQEFEEINQKCMKNRWKEEIIKLVYEAYPEDMHHAELAVRVPHLQALYHDQPDKLEKARKNFPELFGFFEEKIVPDMEKAVPLIESKVDKIVKKKNKQIFKLWIFLILCSVGFIVSAILLYSPNVELKFNELSSQQKDKVNNAKVFYKNFTLKLSDLFPKKSKDALETLSSEHISQILNSQTLNFNDPPLAYLNDKIDLKWESLSEELKKKVLNSKINFQGQIVTLNELISTNSENLNLLTHEDINNILSENKLIIGEVLQPEISFYIERKFIHEDIKVLKFEYDFGYEYDRFIRVISERVKKRTSKYSFDNFFYDQTFYDVQKIENRVLINLHFSSIFYDLNDYSFKPFYSESSHILEAAKYKRILILSAQAGAGKTETFKHLQTRMKQEYPAHWILFIDLKYETKFDIQNGSNIDLGKILEEILSLGPEKTEFEKKIFQNLFESGNVALFWDGFDEISTNYRNSTLNLIKYIFENTKNIQFVSTRPLYSKELRRAFRSRSWDLVPFDNKEKIVFLEKSFEFQNISNDKIVNDVEKVKELIDYIETENYNRYKIDNPLMLKSIIGIYEEEKNLESENLWEIFSGFLNKKIEDWFRKYENVNADQIIAQNNSHSKFIIVKIFKKYAMFSTIEVYLPSIHIKLGKLQLMQQQIPKTFPLDLISNSDIFFKDGPNQFNFLHQIFREFYVAQFLIEKIFSSESKLDPAEAEQILEIFFILNRNYGYQPSFTKEFMHSFLKSRTNEASKKFNPTISSLLRTKFRRFLFKYLDENNPDIFKFLFEFFSIDHDVLVDLLHVNEDETFYTAIFNPKNFAIFVNPEDLKMLARNYLNDEEFQKFIKGKNQKGVILFGMGFYSMFSIEKSYEDYDIEIIKFRGLFLNFFDHIMQNLTTQVEQKNLLAIALNPRFYLYYDTSTYVFSLKDYEDIWTKYENLLTREEMHQVLGEILHDQWGFFSDVDEHEVMIFILQEKIEKFMTSSEIVEMFRTKRILLQFHSGKELFTELYDFLANHTDKAQRREILLQDGTVYQSFRIFDDVRQKFSYKEFLYFFYDFTPFNILHKSTFGYNSLHFNTMLEIYQNNFNQTEIQNIIASSSDFLYYSIDELPTEKFKKIMLLLENLFRDDKKSLKKFLEQKVEQTNLTIFEFIENFVKLSRSTDTINDKFKLISELYEKVKKVSE